MSTTYARELLSLGVPPRAVMHLVLLDISATLREWSADVLTCDEQELVRQARAHIDNAEHCMAMLLRPSEALCEPHYPLHELETIAPPGEPSAAENDAWALQMMRASSTQKEPPASAPTDPGVDEQATAKKPYSPPMLSHLRPDDPRVAKALAELAERDR